MPTIGRAPTSYEPGLCPICHPPGGFHDSEKHKKDSDTIPAHLKRFSGRKAARYDYGSPVGVVTVADLASSKGEGLT